MDQLSKCYLILGLDAGASQEQVKQVYRDLVNVWHPDRFLHDKRLSLIAQEKMKEINGAYEFLKASFFEADIASATNATPEAEFPNAEPDEEISKPKGNRGAMWLVLGFLFLALIGGAFFLLGERRSKNMANPQPTDNALAISQTNKPADLATNSVLVSEAINSPTLPLASHTLAFDGDKSYVKVNTTGSLTGIFTVECWALSERTGAVGILVSSRGPKDYSFDMKFGGDGIDGDIGDGANWLTTKADVPFKYLPDTWYHIAYVVTPGHYMIYINGVLSASKDNSPGNPVLYDTDHPMITMGMLHPDTESLKGFISDVQIWRTARNAAQIRSDMYRSPARTESGLQGYWRFNDATRKIAVDSSGHGFPGTLIGNVIWATNAPPILLQ